MSTQIRLAIFDRNHSVREALRRRLIVDSRVASVFGEDVSNQAAVARTIESAQPHAVLIDPRRTNGAALAELLALREGRNFVVSVHVAHRDYAEERAALAAGCDLYLLKGLKTGQLVDRLCEAIERRIAHLP